MLALAHCTLGEVDEAVEASSKNGSKRSRTIPLRGTCSRRAPVAMSRHGHRTGSSKRRSTVSPASFDSKLAKLSYRAPALVAAMLEDSGVEASKSLDVLDAGCGTGLCGPLMAPYARRLVGVDLSAGMLAQAKEKNVYDELFKVELTAYLRDSPGGVRRDRVGRHARLFRRAGRRRRGRCGAPCPADGSSSPWSTRLGEAGLDYRPSSCTAATATRAGMSSGCWPGEDWCRRSRRPSCVSKPGPGRGVGGASDEKPIGCRNEPCLE